MSGLGARRRRRAILELVRTRAIASQAELARELGERGHRATQSTISRDLKRLRVVRVPGAGGYRYLPAGEERPAAAALSDMTGVTAAEVVAVEANQTVAVVRTRVGRAPGVAAFLDELRPPGLLATVAGDDTVLVLPKSVRQTARLARRLRELFALA